MNLDNVLCLPAVRIPKHYADNNVSAKGSIWEFCVERAPGPVWAEFGVMLGRSARYFLSKLPNDGELYLFDSFDGIPEQWGKNPKGWFSLKAVNVPIPVFDDSRVNLIEGWFEDTLPVDEIFDFVHIDSDLYSSAKTVLESINVRPGTIILFDELYNFPDWENGEYKALSEWHKEYKFIARDSYQRAAIEVL